MKILAFFNNKGGVGKTSLAYHLAWMFSEKNIPTLAVDLDPQANLTTMFLDEQKLEEIWLDGGERTIYGSVAPLMSRVGDIAPPHIEPIAHNLWLIPGDLTLSRFEDLLSENWPKCLDSQEAAFRVTTAFFRAISIAAKQTKAELVLIDVGPNLGAINRSALIASDHVLLPLAPDLFSLQGLRNLGPTLKEWRKGWRKRYDEAPQRKDLELPNGSMTPIGYVVMQHSTRENRPVKAYQRWMEKIPEIYEDNFLDTPSSSQSTPDEYRLALLKNYRSLMPMAMENHKPMFSLKSSDGAIGSHIEAVKSCYRDFELLASRVSEKLKIPFTLSKRTLNVRGSYSKSTIIPTSLPGAFSLKKSTDGQYYFTLSRGNGETILSSELYKHKESAIAGIESVRKNSLRADAFEIKKASNGMFYFTLKAMNGQIIGQSQMYSSESHCMIGIQAVAASAFNSNLKDSTS